MPGSSSLSHFNLAQPPVFHHHQPPGSSSSSGQMHGGGPVLFNPKNPNLPKPSSSSSRPGDNSITNLLPLPNFQAQQKHNQSQAKPNFLLALPPLQQRAQQPLLPLPVKKDVIDAPLSPDLSFKAERTRPRLPYSHSESSLIGLDSDRGYFCKYCKKNWPLSSFKNSQQFGAHCSNCSRKSKAELDSMLMRRPLGKSPSTSMFDDDDGAVPLWEFAKYGGGGNQPAVSHDNSGQNPLLARLLNILENQAVEPNDIVHIKDDINKMGSEMASKKKRRLEHMDSTMDTLNSTMTEMRNNIDVFVKKGQESSTAYIEDLRKELDSKLIEHEPLIHSLDRLKSSLSSGPALMSREFPTNAISNTNTNNDNAKPMTIDTYESNVGKLHDKSDYVTSTTTTTTTTSSTNMVTDSQGNLKSIM
ncbi:hypothetical protein SAMD00019534_032490 [Acytostelium subglobosum LB1]|uniref:hypothetical protein n=1 Tax=Acytostelium subglobosum LB1 TaxID=1410327 RepID=UPI0006452285|nr:hypothetical protein SAMD00019534_032490 [Acytostelium subglobosum LB1]GAM20074.1 hypothetical protein SAMD00019534_032490 [Acytostelium subglobosum LB1]|eukprot:XP_012756836.1 hypothetical protein SAMD00019534_032490 [Acytostelium subglobosum LB1]